MVPDKKAVFGTGRGAVDQSGAHLAGVSSMATRAVLAELAQQYQRTSGRSVAFLSLGGVDAAQRIRDGESFDVVVLARDSIDRLITEGQLLAGSVVDLARSGVAVAVPAGAPRPDVGSEDALKRAGEPKELYIVPNAGHVDLYDRVNLIPFGKLTDFFRGNLSS